MNLLDNVVSKNMLWSKDKLNDIHENELKNNPKDDNREPTPVTLANIKGGKKDRQNKHEGLRVLIDTGCSHSIVAYKYVNQKYIVIKKKKYSTGNGTLETKYESEIHFSLPEFSDKKIINWKLSVAESRLIGYEMIIGQDLLSELKMNICFDH